MTFKRRCKFPLSLKLSPKKMICLKGAANDDEQKSSTKNRLRILFLALGAAGNVSLSHSNSKVPFDPESESRSDRRCPRPMVLGSPWQNLNQKIFRSPLSSRLRHLAESLGRIRKKGSLFFHNHSEEFFLRCRHGRFP